MNFTSFDLNLLRVFDAMMLDLSATRAGERIGLSQPAVSSAVGRLRHLTGDELFVRVGNSMVPTSGAKVMHGPVHNALTQLEETLSAVMRFDPETAQNNFQIIGSDYFTSLLMPRLTQSLVGKAPNTTLQMMDFNGGTNALQLLTDGRIDIVLDREMETPDWISSHTLSRIYILIVAAKGHPVLAQHGIMPEQRIPPEIYCQIPHIIRSIDGGKIGTLCPELRKNGYSRKVAVTVPHFKGVALVTAATELLGSLPVHFARAAAKHMNLDVYLPPFDPPLLDINMYWHRRLDRDPAIIWLRQNIIEAMDVGIRGPVPTVSRTDNLCWNHMEVCSAS